MALHFDVRKVKDWKNLTNHPTDKNKWHPVTECIINKMLVIDCSSITEKSADEVWFRIRILQLIDGPEFFHQQGNFYLTKQDVINHIGLVTNITRKSRNYFLNKVFRMKQIFVNSELNKGKSAQEITNFLIKLAEESSSKSTKNNK